MMNRPSNSTTASSSSSSDPFVPPMMMSFVGLEPNTNQKNQLWDWEPTNPSPNTSHPPLLPHSLIHTHNPFLFQSPPFLEYPPPLLPLNSSPFSPHPFVKQEDSPAGGIGLNLGHRTYFSSGDALAVDLLFARSRGLYAPLRCQAEGCGVDLSAAKHYYRRHKVCEFHSKAAVVVAAGLHQRFCQQCSRFHVLAEFDEVKRSCRKRLADHNRRRRKPQDAKNSTTITNSLGKSKLNPKSTKDTSTTSTKSTTSISNTSVSLEKQEEYQNKASHYSSEDTNLLQLGQAMLEVDFMRWRRREEQGV